MSSHSKDLTIIVLVAAVILALIVSYFIFTFMQQQKKIVKWQQARIAAEIETLENERKRIASDLHDEIGPILSAVKLQINHIEPTEESEKAALEKSSSQIDFVIQKFRDISYNLLPNTLVRKGLLKAADEFIYRVQQKEGTKINFKAQQISLSADKELNVFRIIQEIVHNTIKHAKAKQLTIEIQQEGNKYVLTAKDDGVGFAFQDRMQHANGLGLLNLQSRIEVLNGTFKVDTLLGKGTFYRIEIPF